MVTKLSRKGKQKSSSLLATVSSTIRHRCRSIIPFDFFLLVFVDLFSFFYDFVYFVLGKSIYIFLVFFAAIIAKDHVYFAHFVCFVGFGLIFD